MLDKRKPDYIDPDIVDQLPAVKLCRDVYAGTLHMRDQGRTYLPQFPKEPEQYYRNRLHSAVLYNALRRTVRGLAGIVFQRDPLLTDKVPDEISNQAMNIDLAGRNFASFAQDTYDDSLLDGHHILFIEMPLADPTVVSRADENPRRPYWMGIRKDQVVRQRWGLVDYEMKLVRFAFREVIMQTDGEFGLKPVMFVREFMLMRNDIGESEILFQLYKEDKEAKEGWVKVDERVLVGIDRIPAVHHYTDRSALGISTPPLLDLATENIAHYQLTSDRRNALHTAGIPIPIFVGIEEGVALEVASNRGIQLAEGGSAFYLEPKGLALDQSRQEIRDSEARMAALGLAMLQRDTRAAETAEARRIEKSETDSSLTKSAKSMKLALEDALVIHAQWLGEKLTPDGLVDVHSDFDAETVTPQQIQVMVEMVAKGQLSLRTLWDMLRAGKILPEEFDPDEEMKLIAEDEDRLQDWAMPEPPVAPPAPAGPPTPNDDPPAGGVEE